MKKPKILYPLCAALTLAACTPKDAAQRQAVRDFLMAEASVPDQGFKVLALELRPVTVADSLAVLAGRMVDSLCTLYEGRDPGEVIALACDCKYEQSMPWFGACWETSAVFVLTPDGGRVVGRAGQTF